MAGGQKGALDFVGYPVGQPGAAPALGGLRGFLDFIGYSVGEGGAPVGQKPRRTLLGVGRVILAWVRPFTTGA